MGFVDTSARTRRSIIAELDLLPAENYRKTRAKGVADFAIGDAFCSDDTGEMRRYERIAAAPGYADLGDKAAPATRMGLDAAAKVSGQFTRRNPGIVPAPYLRITTTGDATPGDGGAANYRRVAAEPAHPGKFQDERGFWFEIEGPHLPVEAFGAKGDCPNTDGMSNVDAVIAIAAATNDVASFVAANRAAQALGGAEVTHGRGKIYRVGYTTEYPAIVVGAFCSMRRVGGGRIQLDPTTLPTVAPTTNLPNRSVCWGEIGIGDAFTLTRAQGTLWNGQNTIFTGLTRADFVEGVSLIDLDIRCRTTDTLGAAQRLYGVKAHWNVGLRVEGFYCEGTPNTGLSLRGGIRTRVRNVTALRCGFNAADNTSRNGVDIFGFIVKGSPQLSSFGWSVDGVVSDYNRDEGIAYTTIGGVVFRSLICRGNLDRPFEGDTNFRSTETAASLGQDVCNDITIDGFLFDGLHEDGVTRSVKGATLWTGNEIKARVLNGTIKNIDGTKVPNNQAGSLLAITTNTTGGGGTVDNITLENCSIPDNYNGVAIKGDYQRYGAVREIGCTGGTNSALIAISEALEAVVEGPIRGGAGWAFAVRVDGARPMRVLDIAGMDMTGVRNSVVRLNVAALISRVSIHDNNCDAVRTESTDEGNSYILIANPALRISDLYVRRNRGRWVRPSDAAIVARGDIAVAAGMCANAVIEDNDWASPFKNTNFTPQSMSNAAWFTSYVDRRNGYAGQRVVTSSALPASGDYRLGDYVDARDKSVGNAGFVCQGNGTADAIIGVTVTTVAASAAATVNNAANLRIGMYVSVPGVVGTKRIRDIAGTTVTFDSVADAAVANAALSAVAPVWRRDTFAPATYSLANANALASKRPGDLIYVFDGDAGQPTLAVWNGGSFRRVMLGASISVNS